MPLDAEQTPFKGRNGRHRFVGAVRDEEVTPEQPAEGPGIAQGEQTPVAPHIVPPSPPRAAEEQPAKKKRGRPVGAKTKPKSAVVDTPKPVPAVPPAPAVQPAPQVSPAPPRRRG